MPEVTLVRGAVTLRAFREEEFAAVAEALSKLSGDVAPEGRPDPDLLREKLQGSGRLADGRIDLAIEVDHRLAGQIQARVPTERDVPPGFYSLGIVLYDETDRGKGFGRIALTLLIDWLFEQDGTEALQAETGLSNEPMRTLLRTLGFEEGERIDVFGREDSVFELTRAGWEAHAEPRAE
jgi:RimJ/RimL family protein N-acetyltransferase